MSRFKIIVLVFLGIIILWLSFLTFGVVWFLSYHHKQGLVLQTEIQVLQSDFVSLKQKFDSSDLSDKTDKNVAISYFDFSGIREKNGTVIIPKDLYNQVFEKTHLLYTSIRAVPHFKNGQAVGFKLISISRGSLWEKIGLKRGDILVKINDNVLNIESGLESLKNLKDEKNFVLTIERKGFPIHIRFRVEG